MKTSTLTAIIATAFTLVAFESAQADEGILQQAQDGGTVKAEASECGGTGGCGGTTPEKVSATPETAGASQRIETTAQ